MRTDPLYFRRRAERERDLAGKAPAWCAPLHLKTAEEMERRALMAESKVNGVAGEDRPSTA